MEVKGYIGQVTRDNNVVVFEKELYGNGCFGKGSLSRSQPLDQGGIVDTNYIELEKKKKKRKFFKKDLFSEDFDLVEEYPPDSSSEFLILSFSEAFFLLFVNKSLNILNLQGVSMSVEECWKSFNLLEENFYRKYVSYHYFRGNGWVTRTGIKYGCDYVLYKIGPGVDHAQFCVVLEDASTYVDSFKWKDCVHHSRLSVSVAKHLVICISDFSKIKDTSNHMEVMTNVGIKCIKVKRIVPKNKI